MIETKERPFGSQENALVSIIRVNVCYSINNKFKLWSRLIIILLHFFPPFLGSIFFNEREPNTHTKYALEIRPRHIRVDTVNYEPVLPTSTSPWFIVFVTNTDRNGRERRNTDM